MSKRKSKRISILLLMAALLVVSLPLLTTACSSSPPEPSPESSEQTIAQQLTDIDGDTGQQLHTAVAEQGGHQQSGSVEGEKIQLTISVINKLPPLQYAINHFKTIRPEVEVVVHESGDYDKYAMQLTAQLLSGNADDLFDGAGLDTPRLQESGYMADIYPLMRNDPAFQEDDYFMNVFEAMSYRGKLALFPTSFVYTLFGVNNRYSADLTARFQQQETVTHRQILKLYQEFNAESGLYAHANMDAYVFLRDNIQDYVDFENKTCDFMNPEFIQLLRDLKEATYPKRITDGHLGGLLAYDSYDFLTETLEEEAHKYLFKWTDSTRGHYQALFPLAEPPAFVDYKPIVSESGNMLINVYNDYGISEASPNKELAWEFLRLMTTPEAAGEFPMRYFPVNRGFFRHNLTQGLLEDLEFWRRQLDIEGDDEEVIAQLLSIYEQYSDMPMVKSSMFEITIHELTGESVKAYYQDELTAEQVAAELQNRISLYLIE